MLIRFQVVTRKLSAINTDVHGGFDTLRSEKSATSVLSEVDDERNNGR